MTTDNPTYLTRDEVYLNTYENKCSECDEKPATVFIEVDLGFMTCPVGDGRYCEDCGNEQLERIRELLPPALEIAARIDKTSYTCGGKFTEQADKTEYAEKCRLARTLRRLAKQLEQKK